MKMGTGRMSMSSCAMRWASLRSPPAWASTDRIESETPRRTAAEALLESLRARPGFAILSSLQGILTEGGAHEDRNKVADCRHFGHESCACRCAGLSEQADQV